MHSTVVQNRANHKGLLIPSLLTLEACYAPLLGKEDGGIAIRERGIAIGEREQSHRRTALLYHIELVQENAQDSQRTDETHQEKEDSEEAAPQRAPVGKLILDNRLGNKPSQEDAGQEATDRQEDLSCDEIKHIKQCLVAHIQPIDSPQ